MLVTMVILAAYINNGKPDAARTILRTVGCQVIKRDCTTIGLQAAYEATKHDLLFISN
jgi:hypothetical protein